MVVSWCWCSSSAVTWWTQLETAVGNSSDVAYRVGSDGDVAVGVDENPLAWPIWAFMRGMVGMAMTAGGGWWW